MTVAGKRILAGLKDIQAKRYRSITFTDDGTVIVADAKTGRSASGRNLAEAEAAYREVMANA